MPSIYRKGLKRLSSVFKTPTIEKIKKIHFATTYLCQSRCSFCNIWNIYLSKPELAKSELSLEEIKTIFSSSSYLKHLEEILISGGEPFLRKDFTDLLFFFREEFPLADIFIATNALSQRVIVKKLSRFFERCPESDIHLSISLDGIDTTHDQGRGKKGAYAMVIKTIETLKHLYPDRIKILLSFTITNETYKDLLACYKLSKQLYIGFTMRFAQNSEFYGNLSTPFLWDVASLDAVENDINTIVSDLRGGRGILSNLFKPDLYFFQNMVKYQRHSNRLFNCYSGTQSLLLDPYGNVFPCINLKKPFGNIRETEFDTLWTSKEAERVRKTIFEYKCWCWTECEVFSSINSTIPFFLNNCYSILCGSKRRLK